MYTMYIWFWPTLEIHTMVMQQGSPDKHLRHVPLIQANTAEVKTHTHYINR